VSTGHTALITNDSRAREPRWIGLGHEIVWLREGENGNTSLVIADASDVGKTCVAGVIPGPVSTWKVHPLTEDKTLIAFAAKSTPDGALYNPKDVSKPHSSGRVYDSLFVRHWDHYVEPQRNTIWTAHLLKMPSKVTVRTGRWNLLGMTNLLKDSPTFECPIPPFGGTDHFDLSVGQVAMVSKHPNFDPATHTACFLHTVLIPDPHSLDNTMVESVPVKVELRARSGAATSPVFSPDGTVLACLVMSEDGYESDQNQIDLYHIHQGIATTGHTLNLHYRGRKWDLSPSSIMFSADGSKLLAVVEDTGSTCLFEIELPSPLSDSTTTLTVPRKLTDCGSISDVARASYLSEKLFISGSTLIDSSVYYILDPTQSDPVKTRVSSISNHGVDFGLSDKQVSELWWRGAKDHFVHAWMVKPSFFKAGKTYPLAYLIHGGPQGAWNNQWSTRWNPALFAEAGFIVIAPNPTGSTGYGQAFTDAIRGSWGGLPYEDLVKGFDYIETCLSDFVDTSRAVALGASYGGYMINWIQGHPLGRRFRAMVCHDGVFNMTGQLASDEQYFPIHDLGGPIWTNQEGYDVWDPSRFTRNWATPQLVIHNELDYRLNIAEGLAAFNVLQMRRVESRFLSFPDENHWVLGHENSLLWHNVVLDWITKYTADDDDANNDGVARSQQSIVPLTHTMAKTEPSEL
jgi:pre-mRNA-splicing helicase BRR2